MAASDKQLTLQSINQNILNSQYAVRGELYLRAQELQKQGKEIIFTNVGNPHALGQKPITFFRQVLALVSAPFLLEDPNVSLLFPSDAIARAKHMLSLIPGGVGAYSDSRGSQGIRARIAAMLEHRDGAPMNPDEIFLTDGASVGVRTVLNIIIRDGHDGIMVPIPQYPLYSATIGFFGGKLVPYELDEDNNWALSIRAMQASLENARKQGIVVRALVFINPGNPTGQCLTHENLRDLIMFAAKEKLVLLCDEVYQLNVYQNQRPFISCRQVLKSMPAVANKVEIVSLYTVSKGWAGECGIRGGYFALTNFLPEVVDQVYKMVSVNLSPGVVGQVMMDLLCNPPVPGDVSYPQFAKEQREIIDSLARRARMMTDAFNSLEGCKCNMTEGAMYSFPRFTLPDKAIAEAKRHGKAPDVFYCLRLLEETGISTVPGSGFGQKSGCVQNEYKMIGSFGCFRFFMYYCSMLLGSFNELGIVFYL
eukprot:jgi/Mesvir1/8408/Mv12647-RA.2